MKKLLTLLAFALVTFTGNAQFAKWMKPSKVSSAILKGDTNGDGEITVADVMLTVNYALGKQGESFNAANADVNGDGEITIADVMGTVSTILEGNGGNGGDTSQAYLTCPDDNHPHMIDLGLPSGTLWACYNVGATTPEDHGGYYAWGETEEKDSYDLGNYEFSNDMDGDGELDEHDLHYRDVLDYLGDDIAGTQYDVAHVKWGGSWQMPSLAQCQELKVNCAYERTIINGVGVMKFTGPSGGTIFLPMLPRDYPTQYSLAYWSSTQSPWYEDYGSACAGIMQVGESYNEAYCSIYEVFRFRFNGLPVRPVSK